MGVFNIKYDPNRNLFVFPLDCANLIFEKLEPLCRKKRLNLIGVLEFVHEFLSKPVFFAKQQELDQKMDRKQ